MTYNCQIGQRGRRSLASLILLSTVWSRDEKPAHRAGSLLSCLVSANGSILRGSGQIQMEDRNDAALRGWTRIRATGRLVDQRGQMQDKLAATLAALFTG